MTHARDVVVVGAGPNGLAAAVELAGHGLDVLVLEAADEIGGGTRTAGITLPGFRHDLCSAIHPLAVASPFFRSLPLHQHGLEWVFPPVDVAHPQLDGPAVLLTRSIDDTARGLGADADAYRRIAEPLAERAERLLPELLDHVLHWPRHPLDLARFGLDALRSAVGFARARFREPRTRAHWAGLAGHAVLPLEAPLTNSFALMFTLLAHTTGFPLARGGSQRIAEALASLLRARGGELRTGVRVESLAELPPARAVLLDLMPRAVARIAGERLPPHFTDALLAYRHGTASFKLDFALDGPVPWKDPACARAGTLHLGATLEEIALAERDAPSRVALRPYVLVAQHTPFDPSRAPAGAHTLWAYAHVPWASGQDASDAIVGQLERFAPGFRERVMAVAVSGPRELEARNPNLVGGDISGGAMTFPQFPFRPRVALDPWATPDPGLFLCSSATPPGGGVHGMCGFHAARSALRRRFGRRP
ncbi:MAG: NAD(P)/FAD-dependent oxidoreductase [Vicinamibacteria bacterium]|nr:NAD(P)/FAD-dependent oxidoreductase [Vicinamibacteria bacterium]